jgi:hypothetical protein
MSQTNPLARTWKTTEGVVTIGLGTAVSVVSGVDPSTLPHKWAAAYAVVLAVVLQLSRSWVKANSAATALYQSPDNQAALLAEANEAAADPVVHLPEPVVVQPVAPVA